MMSYKHTFVGIFILFFMVVIYNITVDNQQSIAALSLLVVVYAIWLACCSLYCFIIYPNYFTKGSRFSENTVSILNGIFVGPIGLLFDYNMNKSYKGYSCYVMGAIYAVFTIGNIINLIGLV